MSTMKDKNGRDLVVALVRLEKGGRKATWKNLYKKILMNCGL